MAENFKYAAFVSYSAKDQTVVRDLAQFLYINWCPTDCKQETTHPSEAPPRRETRRQRSEPFRDMDGHLRPAHRPVQRRTGGRTGEVARATCDLDAMRNVTLSDPRLRAKE